MCLSIMFRIDEPYICTIVMEFAIIRKTRLGTDIHGNAYHVYPIFRVMQVNFLICYLLTFVITERKFRQSGNSTSDRLANRSTERHTEGNGDYVDVRRTVTAGWSSRSVSNWVPNPGPSGRSNSPPLADSDSVTRFLCQPSYRSRIASMT